MDSENDSKCYVVIVEAYMQAIILFYDVLKRGQRAVTTEPNYTSGIRLVAPLPAAPATPPDSFSASAGRGLERKQGVVGCVLKFDVLWFLRSHVKTDMNDTARIIRIPTPYPQHEVGISLMIPTNKRPARAPAMSSVQHSNARGREKERYIKVESRREKESEAMKLCRGTGIMRRKSHLLLTFALDLEFKT
ncbi:hypothetical protein EVAR_29968_1 [Eumeta japonica]|uniref:Uncharacterized protein n=1 Tax=Eumeta variegata TaxID=151549 RepID=A0A4C1VFW5_EUMVA|nr:hypothetical protein EVAR_29968_1 [Eumeta japonica]